MKPIKIIEKLNEGKVPYSSHVNTKKSIMDRLYSSLNYELGKEFTNEHTSPIIRNRGSYISIKAVFTPKNMYHKITLGMSKNQNNNYEIESYTVLVDGQSVTNTTIPSRENVSDDFFDKLSIDIISVLGGVLKKESEYFSVLDTLLVDLEEEFKTYFKDTGRTKEMVSNQLENGNSISVRFDKSLENYDVSGVVISVKDASDADKRKSFIAKVREKVLPPQQTKLDI